MKIILKIIICLSAELLALFLLTCFAIALNNSMGISLYIKQILFIAAGFFLGVLTVLCINFINNRGE